jgi:hypothetical protein
MILVQILTTSKQIAFNFWAFVNAPMWVNPLSPLPTVFLCLLQSKLHNIITLCSRENLIGDSHHVVGYLHCATVWSYHFLVHTGTQLDPNLSFFALLFSSTHTKGSRAQNGCPRPDSKVTNYVICTPRTS